MRTGSFMGAGAAFLGLCSMTSESCRRCRQRRDLRTPTRLPCLAAGRLNIATRCPFKVRSAVPFPHPPNVIAVWAPIVCDVPNRRTASRPTAVPQRQSRPIPGMIPRPETNRFAACSHRIWLVPRTAHLRDGEERATHPPAARSSTVALAASQNRRRPGIVEAVRRLFPIHPAYAVSGPGDGLRALRPLSDDPTGPSVWLEMGPIGPLTRNPVSS